jgi:16S rRNA (cytidine1402-2'-O)-methyltransferase
LEAGLWLVATPIGNADDLSIRAMRVLENADVLVCEDTRQTRKLMDIHGIALHGRRMISYNDQNGAGRRPQVMQLLAEGHSVVYASDAGTPLIADPGYRLVEAAQESGHSVHAVPGPSAVLAALSVAGLPTDRFLFLGFPPVKSAARRSEFGEVATLRSTLVLFESPKRLGASLADAAEILGSTRVAAVTRELTKKFEEVHRASLGQLADHYAQTMPKGEVVVVIGPPDAAAAQERYSAEDIDALLQTALETLSTKDAAKQVADQTGLPRRDIYQRAVGISKDVH